MIARRGATYAGRWGGWLRAERKTFIQGCSRCSRPEPAKLRERVRPPKVPQDVCADPGLASLSIREARKEVCLSDPNAFTLRGPPRASLRKNATQRGSAFEGPTSMPSNSRRPSMFTPTAKITATETIRPFCRILRQVASFQR